MLLSGSRSQCLCLQCKTHRDSAVFSPCTTGGPIESSVLDLAALRVGPSDSGARLSPLSFSSPTRASRGPERIGARPQMRAHICIAYAYLSLSNESVSHLIHIYIYIYNIYIYIYIYTHICIYTYCYYIHICVYIIYVYIICYELVCFPIIILYRIVSYCIIYVVISYNIICFMHCGPPPVAPSEWPQG